jgi:hypothetical protein
LPVNNINVDNFNFITLCSIIFVYRINLNN